MDATAGAAASTDFITVAAIRVAGIIGSDDPDPDPAGDIDLLFNGVLPSLLVVVLVTAFDTTAAVATACTVVDCTIAVAVSAVAGGASGLTDTIASSSLVFSFVVVFRTSIWGVTSLLQLVLVLVKRRWGRVWSLFKFSIAVFCIRIELQEKRNQNNIESESESNSQTV